MDPGSIYRRKKLIEKEEKKLFHDFTNSKYGLYYVGNERFFKILLAKNSSKKYQCVAIGSSHIMELGTIRSKHINSYCKSFLNLGVSGGSFEDMLVFLGVLAQHDAFPQKIIIGLDPWTLKVGMDSRYNQFKHYLDYFLDKNGLELKSLSYNSINSKKHELFNLINYEYTKASFDELFKHGLSLKVYNGLNYSPINHDFRQSIIPEQGTLKDGSHLYPNYYLQQNKTDMNYEKEPSYKLNGIIYDPEVLELFKKVIKIIGHSSEVHLLLTPYHPNSFKKKYSKFQKYFTQVEQIARQLSVEMSIKIHGSFYTSNPACGPYDFYDYMHAKWPCIDALFMKGTEH